MDTKPGMSAIVTPDAPARRRAHKFVRDQLRRVTAREGAGDGGAIADEMRRQFGGADLAPDEWAPLVAANPELLVRFINSNSKHASPGQRLANGPALVARRGPTPPDRRRYAGSMLIQSLNAFGNDSILLVASLGRFLRNAHVQGHAAPGDRPVLVTGVSWARKNKSIRNAALNEDAAARALEENLRGRIALCELAGLEPTVCNVEDRPPAARERTVPATLLRDHAARLRALVTTFWPELYDRPLKPHEKVRIACAPFGDWLADCPDELREAAEQVPVRLPSAAGIDLLAVFPELRGVLPRALSSYLTALANIAVHQGRLSEDYFYYFWAQMHVQGPEFRDHLKVAPVSEHRFDEPMFGIRPDDCRMDALYLPHYTLAKTRMLSYSTEHIDLAGKGPEEVAASIVTLAECRQPAATAKLADLLARTAPFEAARVLVDVLSFYVAGLRWRGTRLPAVDEAVRELDPGLHEALEEAADGGPELARTRALAWSATAFDPEPGAAVPFFFQPFFWPAPGRGDARHLEKLARAVTLVCARVAERTGL